VRFLERNAAGLLRFESAQDLYGGLALELLSKDTLFESRSATEDLAWLRETARFYLANRRRYWSALKRDTGRLLRTGLAGATGSGSKQLADFAASQTGPSTFAFRREQLVILTQALSILPDRDRQLVELTSTGTSNEEIGHMLGVTASAAAKAKARALGRLRKAHELATRAVAARHRADRAR
jgi:RNA polymerase sigma factor (sigma-70 family)